MPKNVGVKEESKSALDKFEFDDARFLELLGKLIGETKDHLVNHPPKQVPQEAKAEQHVKKALEKYCGKDGPLTYEVIETVKGRSNVIITYKSQSETEGGANKKEGGEETKHENVDEQGEKSAKKDDSSDKEKSAKKEESGDKDKSTDKESKDKEAEAEEEEEDDEGIKNSKKQKKGGKKSKQPAKKAKKTSTPSKKEKKDVYKGEKTVAFVGSHFDVVPIANPDEWTRDPFVLTVEGDMLYGRGTTDCLGHVALQTELFLHLAIHKPKLNVTVVGVLIADEEVGEDPNVGVTGLQTNGHLELLRGGPVYWLDCADKMPCIGSGGTIGWKLKAEGKGGHSGYPHKAINSVELAMDAVSYLQKQFYAEFSPHPKEKQYKFVTSSSLKPTLLEATPGSLNQIKEHCNVEGDIRTVPFYHAETEIKPAVEGYIKDFNNILKSLVHPDDLKKHEKKEGDKPKEGDKSKEETSSPAKKQRKGSSNGKKATPGHCLCDATFHRGPDTHYHVEDTVGSVSLEWIGTSCDGLAVDMDSPGYHALVAATEKHVGPVYTMADTGTLPLVAELKQKGLDVQCVGYGVEDAYHMDNEFARLSDFKQGFKVMLEIIHTLSEQAK